jgi:hypothetical protein
VLLHKADPLVSRAKTSAADEKSPFGDDFEDDVPF